MEKLLSLIRLGYRIEFSRAFGFSQVEIKLTKMKKSVKFTQSQVLPDDHHLERIPDVLDFMERKLEDEMKKYFNPDKYGKEPTL